MNLVDIQFNEFEDFEKNSTEKKIRLLCDEIFDILDINNWELSIVISNDLFIKNLNREYRGKDEPTDVLSFPQIDSSFPVNSDGIIYAGDIIISLETVKKNAEHFKVELNEEFARLLLHGILHLKGFNHEDNNPMQEMLVFQENIMKKLTGVNIF